MKSSLWTIFRDGESRGSERVSERIRRRKEEREVVKGGLKK